MYEILVLFYITLLAWLYRTSINTTNTILWIVKAASLLLSVMLIDMPYMTNTFTLIYDTRDISVSLTFCTRNINNIYP